jgi:NADH:ubiquinone oxidoreductase subunit B-like Fe-S oxidoreductase
MTAICRYISEAVQASARWLSLPHFAKLRSLLGTATISACGTSQFMNAARPDYDGRSLTLATRISWRSSPRTTWIVTGSPIG